MRITVYDVLDYLASGMSEQEILDDFPDLTRDDICACLAFAADRERLARIVHFHQTRLLHKSETPSFPQSSRGRLRKNPSFPQKRESTSFMKISGFPLSRE